MSAPFVKVMIIHSKINDSFTPSHYTSDEDKLGFLVKAKHSLWKEWGSFAPHGLSGLLKNAKDPRAKEKVNYQKP
ncbi:MAG TPA: hypothetical protein VMS94_00015 [Acidobacteriota bacterium]|jgi:hypothetical protein|nr:hypothetical protein [Acidobacteriota bacterium]